MDVWHKIYTSTTLFDVNISRPGGMTPHPQHRWRPTSLQSWALTTSSSPLHLDQSKNRETIENPWKPEETKHIRDCSKTMCFVIDFCEEFVVDQCRILKDRNPSGGGWKLLRQETCRPRWNPHQHATKLHERWDGRFPQLSRTSHSKFFQLVY